MSGELVSTTQAKTYGWVERAYIVCKSIKQSHRVDLDRTAVIHSICTAFCRPGIRVAAFLSLAESVKKTETAGLETTMSPMFCGRGQVCRDPIPLRASNVVAESAVVDLYFLALYSCRPFGSYVLFANQRKFQVKESSYSHWSVRNCKGDTNYALARHKNSNANQVNEAPGHCQP